MSSRIIFSVSEGEETWRVETPEERTGSSLPPG